MIWITKKGNCMIENKKIPEFNNYIEIAEFWDSHSLADYWNETEPVEFEIDTELKRHHFVQIDREILKRLQHISHTRGSRIETLINLFLEQKLHDIEANPGG